MPVNQVGALIDFTPLTLMVSADVDQNFADLRDEFNNLVTGPNTLAIDTINEQTAANGVVVDGVTLQDGGATLTALLTAGAGITSGGNIVSDTDSTDDLGLTGTRWRNLYVDDVIVTSEVSAAGGAVIIGQSDTAVLILNGADGEVPAGSVGIAEASGGLELSSNGSITIFLDNNNDQSASFRIRPNVADGGTNCFSVDEDGEVILTGTNPGLRIDGALATYLHLYDDGTFYNLASNGGVGTEEDTLRIFGNSGRILNFAILDGYLSIGGTVAQSGNIRVENNNTITWRNAANSADIDFYLDGADNFRMQGTLRPETTGTYDLGLSTIRWQTVFSDQLSLGATPAQTGEIRLGNNDYAAWRNQANSADHRLGLSTADVFACEAHFTPWSDSAYDLGLTSARWANLFVDTIGDTGQALNFAATTVELPNNVVLNFNSGAAAITHSAVNLLTFSGNVGFNSAPTVQGLIADLDGTRNLGSDAIRWGNVWSDSITITNNLTVEGVGGVDVSPGSDVDADLLTVNVTGTPRVWWDESGNAIASTVDLDLSNGVTGTGVLRFAESDGIYWRNAANTDDIAVFTVSSDRLTIGDTSPVLDILIGAASTADIGFYGATPVALQTGVAVTAAAIHAALVNLGLITA